MSDKSKTDTNIVKADWVVASLIKASDKVKSITGKPGMAEFQNNPAVSFNGVSDGFTINEMPLAGLKEFTIEMILNPSPGGGFEQRFLHVGEVQGDRVLLELRATPGGWYSDAFIKSGDNQLALIDTTLLHPYNKWYHLAYVKDNGTFSIYINGKMEMEGSVNADPPAGGQTSVGMRQNEVSWFKGSVYRIKMTAKALKPEAFISI